MEASSCLVWAVNAAIARHCLSHEVFKTNVASLEGMPLRNLVSQVVCKIFASLQSPVSQILMWNWAVNLEQLH